MSQESNRKKILKDRSLMLKKVRSFFAQKKILEVDPPHLVKHPFIDEHIDTIKAYPFKKQIGYLHTSPEHMMKRLIAEGIENIYFLGHVFRKDEIGNLHNIEFTMIEWYKSNTTYQKFIKDNIEILKLFVKFRRVEKLSFFDLFFRNFDLDLSRCTKIDLLNALKKLKISTSKDIEKSSLISLIADCFFSKMAKKDVLYLIYDFLKEETPLAKTHMRNNIEVAKRFEFYLNGFELANGYLELNNQKIIRKRFEKIIKKKKHLTLDENFLKSINHIGNNCYGIAIGFDRLMMLKHQTHNIKDVLYFSYQEL